MSFKPVDRLPVVEWAAWWDKTLERWKTEGLPSELKDSWEIREHLGLDSYRQEWVSFLAKDFPRPLKHIHNLDEYNKILPFMFPKEPVFDLKTAENMEMSSAGVTRLCGCSLTGFSGGREKCSE